MSDAKMGDEGRAQAELRQKAEAALRGISVDVSNLSTEEIQTLMHELQVHQIELEMQNEALREAQLKLGKSRDRFVNLYDFAPVGYLTLTNKGLISRANLTCAMLLGVDREKLLKKPLSHFVSWDDQDNYYLFFNQILKTKSAQSCVLKLVSQEGVEFDAKLESLLKEDGKLRITISDITKRVKAEVALRESFEQLEKVLDKLKETQTKMVQQERLAAVGQLAAGIAHDFNNILAAILLQAQIMLMSDAIAPNIRQKIGWIEQQGLQAADLIQQILDFSRKSMMSREDIDLCLFLEELKRLFVRTLPESIQMSISCKVGVCPIYGDPTRLQQALLNLAINARDAMPDGGELHIELERVEVEEGGKRPYSELPPGRWAKFSVTDTGTGIAESILSHIFEPFFTTRAPLGSGLGLSQVHGIVKQHDGYVDVASVVGKGTEFSIYLPILETSQSVSPPQQPDELITGNNETILIVEDNEHVRQSLVEAMKVLNYRPMIAANGHEALALCQLPEHHISLVLSDLVMPEMGGKQLLKQLHETVPHLNVIIITGYPLLDRGAELMSAGAAGWLQKPIKIHLLSQELARVLEKS